MRAAWAIPFLALLAVALDGPGARPGGLTAAAGVALAIDLITWQYAILYVGAGLATVLTNLQVVLVPIITWALWDERPQRAA